MLSARPWNLVNIVSGLGAQTETGKHLLRKQTNKLFVRVRAKGGGGTFRETCFRNNVFATMFPRLRELAKPFETMRELKSKLRL